MHSAAAARAEAREAARRYYAPAPRCLRAARRGYMPRRVHARRYARET